MSETIDIRDITVTVRPGKFLHVRNPKGPGSRRLRGPLILIGQYRKVRVPSQEEPEVWIIFPAQDNYGLNPDDILNAHWDRIATFIKKNRAGEERNLIQ